MAKLPGATQDARRCKVRPALAVVHRWRSGQSRQAAPKMTALRGVTRRVIPAG